jgi:hypothetical protein
VPGAGWVTGVERDDERRPERQRLQLIDQITDAHRMRAVGTAAAQIIPRRPHALTTRQQIRIRMQHRDVRLVAHCPQYAAFVLIGVLQQAQRGRRVGGEHECVEALRAVVGE